MQAFPPPQGLYDGLHEHDACGVAFVATMTGVPSHAIVSQALTALRNLEHRIHIGVRSRLDRVSGGRVRQDAEEIIVRIAIGRPAKRLANRTLNRHAERSLTTEARWRGKPRRS